MIFLINAKGVMKSDKRKFLHLQLPFFLNRAVYGKS